MEPTHVHLLLNHIPVLGTLFALILLGIAMSIKNRSIEVTALATIALVALLTIPVYLSGEEAEHEVEEMQMVDKHELEEHEEHAELSLWLMLATGAMSLLTLLGYARSPKLIRTGRISVLVLGIITFITLIPLANHGGKIMHPELRGEVPTHQDD